MRYDSVVKAIARIQYRAEMEIRAILRKAVETDEAVDRAILKHVDDRRPRSYKKRSYVKRTGRAKVSLGRPPKKTAPQAKWTQTKAGKAKLRRIAKARWAAIRANGGNALGVKHAA